MFIWGLIERAFSIATSSIHLTSFCRKIYGKEQPWNKTLTSILQLSLDDHRSLSIRSPGWKEQDTFELLVIPLPVSLDKEWGDRGKQTEKLVFQRPKPCRLLPNTACFSRKDCLHRAMAYTPGIWLGLPIIPPRNLAHAFHHLVFGLQQKQSWAPFIY